MHKILLQLILLTGNAMAQLPPTITIAGLGRDMLFFHNDFAPSRDTCVQRGYLFSNLTVLPDWRPRFIPPVLRGYFPISSTGCNYATTLADTLHGQMFFEEWYTDVPGLNAAFPISVTLALNPTTGLYGYSAGSFFPSTPWGYKLENPGNPPRNYGFTSEFKVPFFYRGGEVFTFAGDDDVWVFIDGRLACDIGGLHNPTSCSVNLDTFGSLVVNRSYELTMFHAERRMPGSNFGITTSIMPKNYPPVVSDLFVTVDQGNQVSFTLSGYDPDGNDPLYYRIVTAPTRGSVAQPIGSNFDQSGNTIVYTPKPGISGSDSFTYVMYDGFDDSNIGTVFIEIVPAYAAPIAYDQYKNLTIGDFHSDRLSYEYTGTAKNLSFAMLSQGANGNAEITSDGFIRYQTIYAGSEEIRWGVTDGRSIATASYFLNVRINPPPIASDLTLTNLTNTDLVIELPVTDLDTPRNALTFICGISGTVAGFGVTYRCVGGALYFRASHSGRSEIKWYVYDGYSESRASVFINIQSQSKPPVVDSMITLIAGQAATWSLDTSDPDTLFQDLKFRLVKAPDFGVATLSENLITYQAPMTPVNETLKWQVSDDRFDSDVATVYISVIDAPLPPPPSAPVVTEFITSETFYGILFGGGLLFLLAGLALAYWIYQSFLANKFQKMLEKELLSQNLVSNPLYKEQKRENVNPLYVERIDTAPDDADSVAGHRGAGDRRSSMLTASATSNTSSFVMSSRRNSELSALIK